MQDPVKVAQRSKDAPPPQKRPSKRRELSNERARVWSEERPWPVRLLTWLLAFEGLLLALLGFINLRGSGSLLEILGNRPLYAAVVPLSLLAAIAVIGFLQLRPGAWVVAMLLQGLMLLLALIVYFSDPLHDPVLYAMLFYGVVMVFYLNYAEVPLVFRVQPGEVLVEDAPEPAAEEAAP